MSFLRPSLVLAAELGSNSESNFATTAVRWPELEAFVCCIFAFGTLQPANWQRLLFLSINHDALRHIRLVCSLRACTEYMRVQGGPVRYSVGMRAVFRVARGWAITLQLLSRILIMIDARYLDEREV